ncbi:NGO_0222 family membrane protein [Neisseria sp.]|uniref:NGO_0222 family membrane protein n=1 Tax=Neisseria sp. TaxID=192066 RepID=UPI0035A0D544
MNNRKTLLLAVVFFTLLFMALILLGSYLLSVGSKQFAVAAFLFAFGAVFGQIACLALYLRAAAQYRLTKSQAQEKTDV